MWLLFFTPDSAKSLVAYSVIWVLLLPLYLIYALFHLTPDWQGDSDASGPGVLFVMMLFFWSVVGSILWCMLHVATRKYAGRVPLWSVNRSRPFWTLCWSALAAAGVVICIFVMTNQVLDADWQPVWIIYWAIGAFLILHCRGAIVHQQGSSVDQGTYE